MADEETKINQQNAAVYVDDPFFEEDDVNAVTKAAAPAPEAPKAAEPVVEDKPLPPTVTPEKVVDGAVGLLISLGYTITPPDGKSLPTSAAPVTPAPMPAYTAPVVPPGYVPAPAPAPAPAAPTGPNPANLRRGRPFMIISSIISILLAGGVGFIVYFLLMMANVTVVIEGLAEPLVVPYAEVQWLLELLNYVNEGHADMASALPLIIWDGVAMALLLPLAIMALVQLITGIVNLISSCTASPKILKMRFAPLGVMSWLTVHLAALSYVLLILVGAMFLGVDFGAFFSEYLPAVDWLGGNNLIFFAALGGLLALWLIGLVFYVIGQNKAKKKS